jgi:hypothetical protein
MNGCKANAGKDIFAGIILFVTTSISNMFKNCFKSKNEDSSRRRNSNRSNQSGDSEPADGETSCSESESDEEDSDTSLSSLIQVITYYAALIYSIN